MQDELTEEELEYNRILFEETLATEFPEEDMKDKHFRDKVGELKNKDVTQYLLIIF